MSVTQKEIVDALNGVYLIPDGIDANAWIATLQSALADRIVAEGIAPPDGSRLVPIEPTAEMLVAWQGWREYDIPDHWPDELRPVYGGYRAMLTAAPKPEVKP